MRLARGVVGNRALSASLEEAERTVRSGGGVAAALDGMLPPLSVRLLDAGEAGGNLAAMASRAADTADAETARAAAAAVAMVNRRRGTDSQDPDAPIRLPNDTTLPVARIDIPDDIAPALVPYMTCLIASAGLPMFSEGKPVAPPPGIIKGSDCSAVRSKAFKDADTMLEQAGRKEPGERAAYIDKALAAMDRFQAATNLPPPPATTD
jgi:hypothetical protein